MSVGAIEAFMTEDHVKLDELLAAATSGEALDLEAFAAFREGMLRHIAMEEKVLVPLVRATEWPHARTLRVDHGAIAKMLVPSPTLASCDELRALLARHNPLEEGPEGLYAVCDAAAPDSAAVLERLRAMPRVPVAPHYDGPLLRKR